MRMSYDVYTHAGGCHLDLVSSACACIQHLHLHVHVLAHADDLGADESTLRERMHHERTTHGHAHTQSYSRHTWSITRIRAHVACHVMSHLFIKFDHLIEDVNDLHMYMHMHIPINTCTAKHEAASTSTYIHTHKHTHPCLLMPPLTPLFVSTLTRITLALLR